MKRILLVVLCALGLFALSAAGAAAKPGHGRNGFSGTFQCTDGSRTAIDAAPCIPPFPKPAARVRFFIVPSAYRIQRSPPRGASATEGR